MSVIDREVMDIYSKHFLKVSQSFPFDSSWKKNLPDILRSCFKEAVLEKMQDKLVWVKIQFPRPFHAGSPGRAACRHQYRTCREQDTA